MAGLRRACGHAAQLRLDARQQHAWLDRLVHVVVRTEFEAQHFVELFVARGHHDDHAVELLARLAANLEPVLAGKVHVENHQVRAALENRRHGVVAVQHGLDFVFVFAQITGDQRGQAVIVFDKQDPEWHGANRSGLTISIAAGNATTRCTASKRWCRPT